MVMRTIRLMSFIYLNFTCILECYLKTDKYFENEQRISTKPVTKSHLMNLALHFQKFRLDVDAGLYNDLLLMLCIYPLFIVF